MPSAPHTPAAVFDSSPQSVEIYERGAWWPGSMLGWRHDDQGRCQAWVRVEFAGIVEDAWVDLALLRLPEAVVPASAPEGTGTQHLPPVRGGAVPPAGRRAPSAGGRRRAPEAGDEPSAPLATAAPIAVDGRPLGRHRAPAGHGRHRAGDTGMPGVLPASAADTARAARTWSPDTWDRPPSRSELPPAGPVVRPTSPRPQAEQDLLTRPLPLQEGVGSARRSRRDSFTGV